MADDSTGIRAIQTRYAGCHFRSRLEARWAVFFDAAHIRWEYEPERFAILNRSMEEMQRGLNTSYLPDFYLPDFGTWAEVKGSKSGIDPRYLDRVCGTYDISCLPGMEDSQGSTRGLVLLGPMPNVYGFRGSWTHPIIQKYKGLVINGLHFANAGPRISVEVGRHPRGIDWGRYCPWSDCTSVEEMMGVDGVPEGWAAFSDSSLFPAPLPSMWIHQCYSAARSARFEHGQEGV